MITKEQWKYIYENIEFYSAVDLKRRYGKSHQYWSFLMHTGKIIAKKVGGRMITTSYWVEDYLNKKK